MNEEFLVTAPAERGEETIDRAAIRPRALTDYIGQPAVPCEP